MSTYKQNAEGVYVDKNNNVFTSRAVQEKKQIEGQMGFDLDLEPTTVINEENQNIIEERGVEVVPFEGDNSLSMELDENVLELIKPGKFDIRNFHHDLKNNTQKVLYQLLALQSNDTPLKKGGEPIAYRCDALIMKNRQEFTAMENTLFDIILATISSKPDDETYCIYANDVRKLLPYNDDTYVYKILNQASKSLLKKPLIFDIHLPNGNADQIAIPWYQIMNYQKKSLLTENGANSYLIITPTDFFKMLIISSSVTHGAHYPVAIAAQIQSGYVKNLYYWLESKKHYRAYPNATPGVFEIDIKDFREVINFPATYRPADIKRRILDPGKEEINKIDGLDFAFDYELIKTTKYSKTKKTTDIKFYISKKVESIEMSPVVEVIEQKEIYDSELREKHSLVFDLLKNFNIDEKSSINIVKKYVANNRDIPFLTNALVAVQSDPTIESIPAMLCWYMENGIVKKNSSDKKTASNNRFNNFEQRSYEERDIENILLNTNIPDYD